MRYKTIEWKPIFFEFNTNETRIERSIHLKAKNRIAYD